MKLALATLLMAIATVTTATVANASPFNCEADVDGSKLDAVVTIGDATTTSTLTLDGNSVPALGACFEMQRPGTRFLRCAHQLGDVRVEIYPWVETVGGALKSMEVVIWHGAKSQRGSFNCAQ